MPSNRFSGSSGNLRELYRLRTLIENRIDRRRAQLNGLRDVHQSDRPYVYAFAQAISELVDVARDIVATEAIRACGQSGEYNHPFFIDPLVSAIMKEGTITVQHEGGTRVNITIDLNSSAGTLEDYARGIRLAREVAHSRKKAVFGKKPQLVDAELGTKFWYEKYYQAARQGRRVLRRKYNFKTRQYDFVDVTQRNIKQYWETMKLRITGSGKPAPWWWLLNFGNAIGLPTDIGGKASPQVAPTYFITKAVNKLDPLFESVMLKYYGQVISRLRSRMSAIDAAIDKLEALLRQIEEWIQEQIEIEAEEAARARERQRQRGADWKLLDDIRKQLEEQERIRRVKREARIREAEQLVRSRLGERFTEVDPKRLKILLDELASGTMSNRSGRIRLGHGIQVRFKSILRQIDQEIGR